MAVGGGSEGSTAGDGGPEGGHLHALQAASRQ